MGVSGAGKTAVGERVARRMGWSFVDGDDLHPARNIEKMRDGVPLTDEDRWPWLERVRDVIAEHAAAGRSAVVACSALKKDYRVFLLAGRAEIQFVYLRGSLEVFERRLSERRGHFFDPNLLASQFEALEEPSEALVVDANQDLAAVVDAVVAGLKGSEGWSRK